MGEYQWWDEIEERRQSNGYYATMGRGEAWLAGVLAVIAVGGSVLLFWWMVGGF